MAIPEPFLDELLDRTDIVDLVSESVRLTQKGRNYWGLCPFHSEKTPSFSVSADKRIFKCFGCGKGGGAINFVMELDNLSLSRSGGGVGQAGRNGGARQRPLRRDAGAAGKTAGTQQAGRPDLPQVAVRSLRGRRDWPICKSVGCPAPP